MKILCELNDQIVLGSGGLSRKPPRQTVRAVARDGRGLYAVLYSARHDLWCLPGGGIEEGEDPLSALRRELLEETGCLCGEVEELGLVLENRACYDFVQKNRYYAAAVRPVAEGPRPTEKEREDGQSVRWLLLDEVERRIAGAVHDTPQKKYIQARDMAALAEYRRRIG